ncbi:MAG: neutral zinc metallopeptidase [Ilumatobacteraceae bacterium]
MRVRAALPLLLAGALLAACGTVDAGVTATKSRDNSQTPVATTDDTAPDTTTTDTTDTTNEPDKPGAPSDTAPTEPTITVPDDQDVIDFGDAKTPRDYDGFLIAAFQDIESFWAQNFPELYGKDFQQLQGGIFAAYPERTTPIPGCQSPQTKYSDVEGNAFYCSDGDFIVYDDDFLLPELVKSLGQSAVGVVLAHEFGHAIQARAGELNEPTILKEQQADCFAGAWAAHVARGEADGLTFGDEEIKLGLVAMIQVRDPVDGNVNDPNAHGTGFDRVGAFQDGFTGGVERCKPFFTENRKLIDIQFDPVNDPTGNLPFDNGTEGDDIKTLIPADLNRFWVQKLQNVDGGFTAPTLELYPSGGPFPKCDGVDDADFKANQIFFCASTNEIVVDENLAQRLSQDPDFGDMSVGYLIGEAYSEAVQTALKSTLKGKARVLLDDCFTGAWVADDIPGTDGKASGGGEITLSAGDLDEAIITALQRSDDSTDTNKRGTAFEKIASFRNGVLNGIDACRAQINDGG